MEGSRINDAREFLNSLVDSPIKLPFEPSLLPELFKSISDTSRASMQDIAELVARSQGLAAKVLSVANSACYGLLHSVSSLDRAVQVLGVLDLRSLVVMFGMSGAIPQRDLPKGFPTKLLWEHQLRTAKLGRLITRIIAEAAPKTPGLPEPESVYAAGILHDVGKVVLAYRRPLDWQNITNINNYKGLSIAAAEDEYWGIDHGSIGGILLKDWNLPDLLSQMVSWHHHPRFASQDQLAVGILAAANVLAESKLLPLEGLSPEQAEQPESALPLEFLELLPDYAKFFGRRYADILAVMGDSHTSAFVGAA